MDDQWLNSLVEWEVLSQMFSGRRASLSSGFTLTCRRMMRARSWQNLRADLCQFGSDPECTRITFKWLTLMLHRAGEILAFPVNWSLYSGGMFSRFLQEVQDSANAAQLHVRLELALTSATESTSWHPRDDIWSWRSSRNKRLMSSLWHRCALHGQTCRTSNKTSRRAGRSGSATSQ